MELARWDAALTVASIPWTGSFFSCQGWNALNLPDLRVSRSSFGFFGQAALLSVKCAPRRAWQGIWGMMPVQDGLPKVPTARGKESVLGGEGLADRRGAGRNEKP